MCPAVQGDTKAGPKAGATRQWGERGVAELREAGGASRGAAAGAEEGVLQHLVRRQCHCRGVPLPSRRHLLAAVLMVRPRVLSRTVMGHRTQASDFSLPPLFLHFSCLVVKHFLFLNAVVGTLYPSYLLVIKITLFMGELLFG